MREFFEEYGGVALGVLALLVLIVMVSPLRESIDFNLRNIVRRYSSGDKSQSSFSKGNEVQKVNPDNINYLITYESNGGTAVANVESATFPTTLPKPSKSGYRFAGWYLDSGLTKEVIPGQSIDANKTLYAKWISESVPVNPYKDKITSVQQLYDVGENNLTANDIVNINGIDCYVLQVDRNKAELITVDIYNQRFGNGVTDYSSSALKAFMDNFYTSYLGSNAYILDTSVTYRYGSGIDEPSSCATNSLNQKVFALDAYEAKSYETEFGWSKTNGWEEGFWVAANDGNTVKVISNTGLYTNASGFDTNYGARPVFWISLEDR